MTGDELGYEAGPFLVWSFDYGADSEPPDWERLLHDPVVPISFVDSNAARHFCEDELREALGLPPLAEPGKRDGMAPPPPVVLGATEGGTYLRRAIVRTGKGQRPIKHITPKWEEWEGGWTWDCQEFRVRFFITRPRSATGGT